MSELQHALQRPGNMRFWLAFGIRLSVNTICPRHHEDGIADPFTPWVSSWVTQHVLVSQGNRRAGGG